MRGDAELLAFADDEREDLAEAAAEMARYLTSIGLADVARQIGRERGEAMARVFLARWFELRERRFNTKARDDLPF